jgi:23S rRNA C2498 (ribose-2'-O)-methylase RlmM
MRYYLIKLKEDNMMEIVEELEQVDSMEEILTLLNNLQKTFTKIKVMHSEMSLDLMQEEKEVMILTKRSKLAFRKLLKEQSFL